MEDRARELASEALALRTSGDLIEAGDTYTAAAHEYAGIGTRSFPEPGPTYSVLAELLNAATCYLVGDDDFHTQNRCDLGTVLAEDHIEYVHGIDVRPGSFADIRRGAWHEYIGDLRTIAERDDAAAAYDRAISIYRSAEDFEVVLAEQEHIRLGSYFRSIRHGLGEEIPNDAPERMGPGTTFVEWVEYKRDRLPDLLDQLEAQGEWPARQGD